MTRAILGTFLTAAMVGCTGFHAVGPLANPAKPTIKKASGGEVDLPAEPITVPAVKPTPPMNLVDPSEVAVDPYSAAGKLAEELEADQKSIPTPSRTAEISRIKGGIQ